MLKLIDISGEPTAVLLNPASVSAISKHKHGKTIIHTWGGEVHVELSIEETAQLLKWMDT